VASGTLAKEELKSLGSIEVVVLRCRDATLNYEALPRIYKTTSGRRRAHFQVDGADSDSEDSSTDEGHHRRRNKEKPKAFQPQIYTMPYPPAPLYPGFDQWVPPQFSVPWLPLPQATSHAKKDDYTNSESSSASGKKKRKKKKKSKKNSNSKSKKKGSRTTSKESLDETNSESSDDDSSIRASSSRRKNKNTKSKGKKSKKHKKRDQTDSSGSDEEDADTDDCSDSESEASEKSEDDTAEAGDAGNWGGNVEENPWGNNASASGDEKNTDKKSKSKSKKTKKEKKNDKTKKKKKGKKTRNPDETETPTDDTGGWNTSNDNTNSNEPSDPVPDGAAWGMSDQNVTGNDATSNHEHESKDKTVAANEKNEKDDWGDPLAISSTPQAPAANTYGETETKDDLDADKNKTSNRNALFNPKWTFRTSNVTKQARLARPKIKSADMPDGVFHQVVVERGEGVRRQAGTPKYLDNFEKPYAVFRFKYRTPATLNEIPGVEIPVSGPSEEDVARMGELLGMAKEELAAALWRKEVSCCYLLQIDSLMLIAHRWMIKSQRLASRSSLKGYITKLPSYELRSKSLKHPQPSPPAHI
jgi:hypothetical protein